MSPSHEADHRPALLHAAMVFLLIFVCHLWRLGTPPLAGTEGHRAVTAHQMVEADRFERWVIPHLYDRPYLRKPPLQYWILSAAETVGGANTWAWRVPSAGASALTGVVLYCFSSIWFGRRAGRVAGFGFFSIVALWSQSRSIDIDANNTLAATIAACTLVHLHARRAGTIDKDIDGSRDSLARTIGWICVGALSFGATLLLKGPAALPIVLGAVIGSVIAYRRWRWSSAGVLLGGVALAAAYGALAVWTARHYGISPDVSGVNEGLLNLIPRDAKRLLRAAILSPQLFAFALPMSLGLILAFHPLVRKNRDEPANQIVRALAWSVLSGWGVCFVSGMVNPRYGYVTLPLLAALSAGVVHLFRSTGSDELRVAGDAFFRVVLTCTALLVTVATVVLTVVTWADETFFGVCFVGAVVSLAVGEVTLTMLVRKKLARGAVGTLLLFVLLTIPFASLELKSRTDRSGLAAAGVIKDAVGTGTRVTVGRLMAYQPELFYYAGVQVDSVGEDMSNPARIQPGRWLVLDRREWDTWKAQAGQKLSRVTQTTSNKAPVVIAWYE